ncbi:ketopantoate reductase family protein [Neobacillus drentensis]|uniref:ketopantoate reductase family protein n=1 Tax=Neobacillus drentensis TaxID=220684 RepID=UPI003003947F
MKIGVAGTGAVGGYFGGLLKKAGNDVVFLARGNNLERLQEKGLMIESEVGKFTTDGFFTDKYEAFSDIDLLLFCVKATDTNDVAIHLQPFLKENCLIMTLQNGVDNEEILSSIFGERRILSAAAYIQASVIDSGVVKQIGVPPRLIIGAVDANLAKKVDEIATLFNEANIESFTSPNVIKIKWNKLLWNVTFNPLTALIESRVGAIYDDEGLHQLAIKICKESIAVAVGLGIDMEEDFYETILAQGQLAKDHQTSMLQDMLKGKTLELESICGYIVKKGREVKVETPVLETIYYLLN